MEHARRACEHFRVGLIAQACPGFESTSGHAAVMARLASLAQPFQGDMQGWEGVRSPENVLLRQRDATRHQSGWCEEGPHPKSSTGGAPRMQTRNGNA